MSERLAVRNPRSGAADYEIPRFGPAEIAPLAERMRIAQKKWLAAGVTHRVSVLQDFVAALHRHLVRVIIIMSYLCNATVALVFGLMFSLHISWLL